MQIRPVTYAGRKKMYMQCSATPLETSKTVMYANDRNKTIETKNRLASL